MADLEVLKQKYATVLQLMAQRQVRVDQLHLLDNRMFVRGAAPTLEIKNEVWTAIKAVDPGYADLNFDIGVDSSIPAPAAAAQASPQASPQGQTYTVQPGDSLSKISKKFYGDANRYMTIFKANQDKLKDPDKISPGQELKIPAA